MTQIPMGFRKPPGNNLHNQKNTTMNKSLTEPNSPPIAGENPPLEGGQTARPRVEPVQIPCAHCGILFARPHGSARACCSKRCSSQYRVRNLKKSQYWWINSKGYLEGCVWENGVRRRMRKHRWLMERHLGRKLQKSEDVHHKDGNKLNNDISNLEVIGRVEHSYLHNRERAKRLGWNPPEREVRRIRLRSIERAIKSRRLANEN